MKNVFGFSGQSASGVVQSPIVYVEEKLRWEYKQITRNLVDEQVLNENELNMLGSEGWELTDSVIYESQAYFYFKRLVK